MKRKISKNGALRLSLGVLKDKLDELTDVLEKLAQKTDGSVDISRLQHDKQDLLAQVLKMFEHAANLGLAEEDLNKIKRILKKLKIKVYYLNKKIDQLKREYHRNKDAKIAAELKERQEQYNAMKALREKLDKSFRRVEKWLEVEKKRLQKELRKVREQIKDLGIEITSLKREIAVVDKRVQTKISQLSERSVPMINEVNARYGTSIPTTIVESFIREKYLEKGSVPPESTTELTSEFKQYVNAKVDLSKLTEDERADLLDQLEDKIFELEDTIDLCTDLQEKANLKIELGEKEEEFNQLKEREDELIHQEEQLEAQHEVLLKEPELRESDESSLLKLMDLVDAPQKEEVEKNRLPPL